MWVKFELTGELEEQFKALCNEECRTLSQQGLYIVKQYLKNNGIEQARTDENKSEQVRTETEQKQPKVVDIQAKKGNKQEQVIAESEQVETNENKSEQMETEQNKQEDFGQMEDDLVLDVLNF